MTVEPLNGRKVAFLAADGVQQDELAQPWAAIEAAGGKPVLVSIKPGDITSTISGQEGRKFHVDRLVADVGARDYAALVIPGGSKSADALRRDDGAVALVRSFMEYHKPVAAICHGPWLLTAADVVHGRTLKGDIRAAGGAWVDRQVSVDQKLVTSQTPADLLPFCSTLVAVLSNAIQERALDAMVEQTFPASDPLPGPTSI